MKSIHVSVVFTTIFVLMTAMLFVVPHAVAAPPVNPGGSGYLDAIVTNFQNSTSSWMTTATGYAQSIFRAAVIIDLVLWGAKNLLKKNDLADFIGAAVLKLGSITFFYYAITDASTWVPLITDSFAAMGQGIGGATVGTGGVPATSPSQIIGQAFSVIASLWNVVQNNSGWTHLGTSVLFSLIAAATSLLALIGFGLVALQLMVTKIEMYLVAGAGLVMLGFTGSSLTSSFGEKYIGYMISVGIKLLVIYAIVGLGGNIIASEITYINNFSAPGTNFPPMDLLSIGTTMLIYGVIGMQVPGMAGSLMNGSPNMSLGNVAGGAAAIAGGVAAAGMAAAAGAAGAAQGLAKMADLVGAGAGGASGAAGGIGGSMDALSGLTSGASSSGAGASMGSMGGESVTSPSSVIDTGSNVGQALSARFSGGNTAASTTGSTPLSAAGGKPLTARFATTNPAPDTSTNTSTASSPTASAVSAPGNGTTDALAAPASASGTESGEAGDATDNKAKDPNHWKTMGEQLGKLVDKKDDIARHEGSTGNGIQIRLNHME